MDLNKEDPLSDEEIFLGELSLKEIKGMFISNQNHRQTIAANELFEEDDRNVSLKLLSTQSEPDITSAADYSKMETESNCSENSFLKFEKAIEELNESSNKECLDNTLEAIERILNSVPTRSTEKTSPHCYKTVRRNLEKDEFAIESFSHEKNPVLVSSNSEPEICLNAKPSSMFTPVKRDKNEEVFATPSSVLMTKKSVFKTPSNPPLVNKPSTSSLKKTPSKNNAFKHIASPVAYYIKNSPQVPLIQNVNPKKPSCSSSCIPKLIRGTTVKPSNKENVNLPSIAYKSAKKTTVIEVSSGPKMPQSEWAKKLTKSLQRPAVIKHSARENELTNKLLQSKQEDSFGDLSLHQADLSVYTKKVAF